LGTHLGTLKGKFGRTCAAVAALADTQCAHALMRSCLGPAKVQYALRTLPLRHTAVFAADITATQRATWDAVVGTPKSDAEWVQTTLPMSEGGCGMASAADVAPVARLAGFMQFLARTELMLGCDRQLVVPLATEAGLLDALNARLPPALEPLASSTRTGKVELPDGDVRRQHWWSSRVTQAKAAALLEVAAGRDVPRLEAQLAGKAGGLLSAPPVAGQGLCLTGAHYSILLKWHLGVPLLPADCAGSPCPLCGGPVDGSGDHAVSCKKSGFGDRHLGTQTFFCQVLTQSRLPRDREVDIAGNGGRPADILLKAWDGRRDLAVDLTIVHPNQVNGRPLRDSAATFLEDEGEQKCRESAESCERMGVDFSPMVFDTLGGLHGAGKEVVKAVFSRCTAPLLPSARQAAVGALPQGLSVQLGRLVAPQLEALMMVSTEAPAWWAAAHLPNPAFTAAGNSQL